MDKLTGFFIGCSSPEGFTAFLDELYNPHDNGYAYIIKGGPGTGKSTLMKKIYSILRDKGIHPECIFCSSDPDSLDALIIPELNCCIADGTSPHAIEPKYYGVCEEFINLGDYLDKSVLAQSKENIIAVADQNKSQHDKCKNNLKAAALAMNEIQKLVCPAVDRDKIKSSTQKIIEKEFFNSLDKKSKVIHRYISAPTSKGLLFNQKRVLELCSRFYIIDDEYCSVAPLLLECIRDSAEEKGYDMILSPNAILGKDTLEHILIPELKLGFISSQPLNKINLPNAKRISAFNFINRDILNKSQNKLHYYLNARNEFIELSLKALKSSKISHDKLESMYIRAMNFDMLNPLSMDISSKMFKKI